MEPFKKSHLTSKFFSYNFLVSSCIPEFAPLFKDKSEIINDENRKLITFFLPGLIRMREWKLLFSISKDGVSMNTFFRNTRNRDNTVLLI